MVPATGRENESRVNGAYFAAVPCRRPGAGGSRFQPRGDIFRMMSYELLEHTGEVQLRIRAADLAGLLVEAGRAVADLMGRSADATGSTIRRRIRVNASDRAALLVDWLNELIYLAESERCVPADFTVIDVSGTELIVDVAGAGVREAPSLVKAATHHGLVVRDHAGGLEAMVILDI